MNMIAGAGRVFWVFQNCWFTVIFKNNYL